MMYGYEEERTAEENIALALYQIAYALEKLGLTNAGTQMGALELVAKEVKDGLGYISSAIEGIQNENVV